jgi:hypothetical protein
MRACMRIVEKREKTEVETPYRIVSMAHGLVELLITKEM